MEGGTPPVADGLGWDTTPAERRASASRAAKERWRRDAERKAAAAAARAAAPAAAPPGEYRTIADYDAQIGTPPDWTAALQREKVRGQFVENEQKLADLAKARVALDRERGNLIPLKEVEDREEAADAIFREHLRHAVDLAAELVPPDQIPAARERASLWVDQQMQLIARAMAACAR